MVDVMLDLVSVRLYICPGFKLDLKSQNFEFPCEEFSCRVCSPVAIKIQSEGNDGSYGESERVAIRETFFPLCFLPVKIVAAGKDNNRQ